MEDKKSIKNDRAHGSDYVTVEADTFKLKAILYALAMIYGVMPLAASSLLHYDIRPTDSAKTDVTMRFYVENWV